MTSQPSRSRWDPVAGELSWRHHVAVQKPVIERLAERLDELDPGGVIGLYVYGSSAASGLRPGSDIDLLLITERSLNDEERTWLVEFLRQFSGRRATVVPGRPLELTSVVLSDVVPWTYPPVCDFLYGEWLRSDFDHGQFPLRCVNPDLAVLLSTVQQHAQLVRGPDPVDLLPPVPPADLFRSLHDGLSPLLEDLVGDERNVLLTLARMIVTLKTGGILSKHEAVRQIVPSLEESDRSVLNLAASGYLGEVEDDWSTMRGPALATATVLAEQIRATATD